MIELIFILISLVIIVFILADKFTSFLLGEHKK